MSYIVDHFYGQTKGSVQCPVCEKMALTFFPSTIVNLPVPTGDCNLFSCVDLFQEESIADSYYCSGCKGFVDARHHLSVWKTPNILVFHLQRFQQIGGKVEFPLHNLDLSNYGIVDSIYQLSGVVEHNGTFTSYSKLNLRWYKLNEDGPFVEVSEDDVQNAEAYLLFYQVQK